MFMALSHSSNTDTGTIYHQASVCHFDLSLHTSSTGVFRAEPRGSHTIWPASLTSQTSIAHAFIQPPSFTGASVHLLPQVSLISQNIPVCEKF